MKSTLHFGRPPSGMLLACLAVLCLSTPWTAADPPGGEPPPCCCCDETSEYDTDCTESPQTAATGGSSIGLTEGNLRESLSVAEVKGAAGTTLQFHVVYNSYLADGSQGAVNTVLGRGWTHSYNVLLYEYRSQIFKLGSTGRTTLYKRQPDGSYKPATGHSESLVRQPDGSITLHRKDGSTLRFERIVPAPPYVILGEPYVLTSVTDRNGNAISLTYAGGLLKSITDPYGRSIGIEYNSDKKIAAVTDPLGRKTRFHYSGTGGLRLVKIVDALGQAIEYTYNTSIQLVQKKDRRGKRFTYGYNGAKKPVSIVDDMGQMVFSLTNGANWGIDQTQLLRTMERRYTPATTTKKDGNGAVWKYTYDANGQPTKVVAPDGGTTVYSYDPVSLSVKTVTDPLGRTTSYQYDGKGNLVKSVDALGHPTVYTYDPVFNRPTSMLDASLHLTTWEYDASGNLVKETDPAGGVQTYTYDAHGRILTETDANGHITSYSYDASGNLQQVTDPTGAISTYTYDAVGNMTAATDPRGHTTQYFYDALNRQVRIVGPLGYVTETFYDGDGNIVKTVDANGHTTQFEYDHRSRRVKTTNAAGGVRSETYDGNGNRLTVIDESGRTTAFTYDSMSRLVRTTDAAGGHRDFVYDAVGNRVSETDANGNATQYAYDTLDRVVVETDALGGVTQFEYDAVGAAAPCCGGTEGLKLPTKKTDANGKVTYYKYDALRRLVKEIRKEGDTADLIDASDAVTEYTYDAVGNRLAVKQPNGVVTTYVYDSGDRLATEINGAGEATHFTYDLAGNVVTTVLANGNTVTMTYDAMNRRTSVADSMGVLMATTYDGEDHKLTETNGVGSVTQYTYDALNRLTSATDALGHSHTLSYDAVGNLLSETDRKGQTTQYAYDVLNRRVQTTDALGHSTVYAHDHLEHVVQVTDANGSTTRFEYDPLNRLALIEYADGGVQTYVYDAVGNLMARQDQAGRVTSYEYNDLYHLVRRDYPSGDDDEFIHDLAGRVLTATKGSWEVTFAYDGANRVTTTDQGGRSLSYLYDVSGRTRTVDYPGGRVVTEHLDVRDRIERIEDAAGTLVEYTYDGADRVVSREARNGVTASLAHTPTDWVTTIDHMFGALRIAGFDYGHDNEGNRLFERRLHDLPHSEAYAYDAIDRLIEFRQGPMVGDDIPVPSTRTQYALDGLGNWNNRDIDGAVEVRAHNAVNELIQVDAVPLAYADLLGNLTDDGVYAYAYDVSNRLTQVTRKSDLEVVGRYQYDALGRRVRKLAEPAGVLVETLFFYDGNRVVEETDAAFATLATYVYGNGLDEVLNMERGGQDFYYHPDALGSIVALTDGAGAAVERYAYDAYGCATVMDGLGAVVPDSAWGAPVSPAGNPHLFTGRYHDEETGLYHYRARMYHCDLGRFLQRDPLGYADGLNLYEYAMGNPVNRTDPLGLKVTLTNVWVQVLLQFDVGPLILDSDNTKANRAKKICYQLYRQKLVDFVGELGIAVMVAPIKAAAGAGTFGALAEGVAGALDNIETAEKAAQELLDRLSDSEYGAYSTRKFDPKECGCDMFLFWNKKANTFFAYFQGKVGSQVNVRGQVQCCPPYETFVFTKSGTTKIVTKGFWPFTYDVLDSLTNIKETLP